ncbi:hypothetical protein COSO111634_11270 [Corallococcus soli]
MVQQVVQCLGNGEGAGTRNEPPLFEPNAQYQQILDEIQPEQDVVRMLLQHREQAFGVQVDCEHAIDLLEVGLGLQERVGQPLDLFHAFLDDRIEVGDGDSLEAGVPQVLQDGLLVLGLRTGEKSVEHLLLLLGSQPFDASRHDVEQVGPAHVLLPLVLQPVTERRVGAPCVVGECLSEAQAAGVLQDEEGAQGVLLLRRMDPRRQ